MAEVISVRFRGNPKSYYFDPKGLAVEPGEYVVVETSQGLAYARCVESSHEVPDETVPQPLREIVRLATENDHKTAAYNQKREKEAFGICEQKIAEHGLEMKLVGVECCFEGNKIIFFFTADGRVDFRGLVKDLAGVFRTRIELRQIGVRDEAKMLGGIGICGRTLCCSQFLNEFIPVSIKMAKTQNLSLNPTKISGACGRLMCCLKYEQAAYEDAAKRVPKMESFVDTPDGVGNVSGVDVLREQVQVRLDTSPESPRKYHSSEIRVLRSGKGSREGIEVPKERPTRTSVPEERDVFGESRFNRQGRAIHVPSTVYNEAQEGGEDRRQPNRRSGGKGQPYAKQGKAKPAQRAERTEKRPDKPEKVTVRPAADTTAEKKAAADRAMRQEGGGKPYYRKTYKRPRWKNNNNG